MLVCNCILNFAINLLTKLQAPVVVASEFINFQFQATKYNYSSAEKYALVEVIAMIKGLQVLMHGMEATFMEAIKRTIFTELQTLVQVKLRDVLRKSVKKQKQLVTM
jgi:hypothetical protein